MAEPALLRPPAGPALSPAETLARTAEQQKKAIALLAKERAAGVRQGAADERRRADERQAAALAAQAEAHGGELARRDALQEKKLAEQKVEIRGAAFWRAATTLGAPFMALGVLVGALLTAWAVEQGAVNAGAATRNVLEQVGAVDEPPVPLTVRDPAALYQDPDFDLPDVMPAKDAGRPGREPADAPRR